jgi:hypothetical protein
MFICCLLILGRNGYSALSSAINEAIKSSYEMAKIKEGQEKAKNATKYGRVSMVGEAGDVVHYEGFGAEELNKMPPEQRKKVLVESAKIQFQVKQRECLPWEERIIEALEEYAGYFLFWEAYAFSYWDAKNAKRLLEETAKRYPEAGIGKLAKSILDNKKDEKGLALLIQMEFKKIPNPVEEYSPAKGEKQNSLMNNLKKAIAPSVEYKKWKNNSSLSLNRKECLRSSVEAADAILSTLDELIASKYYVLGSEFLAFAFGNKENIDKGFDYWYRVVNRYPHTRTANFALDGIEVYKKALKRQK